MRRLILLTGFCFVVFGCGDGQVVVDSQEQPAVVASTTSTTTPSTTTTTTEPPAPGPAFGEVPEGSTLVVKAVDEVEVYSEPDAALPSLTLEPTTILGTETVLAVLEQPVRGWARVMLPIRPNGSEGWVQIEEMTPYLVHGRVVVDLSERTLTYQEAGVEVISTTVAVGSSRNPTPTGTFFVTDNVTLSDPNSPWGPHAFGLSARSETITEYNGGDGIIGIHGTNKPGSIGEAASLGCVRVPNDVIATLHDMIAAGTPVEIRA
jgi:hypothetical protein